MTGAEPTNMKLKYLAALLALTVTQGAVLSPVFAQDVKNINKWFDDINKKYPNLQKKQNVGDLQNPGKLQTPGKIQNAGNINAPQGLKAIKTTSAPCSQRFLIGADTLFEFDQATLTPRAEETLTVLGPMIQNVGAHPVVIEGHTDSKGTDDYNQQLSERRAERVRNWFLEHRIVEKRAVSTVGYGEKKPVAPNEKPDGKDNPPGRALNRRVEIVVNTCAGIDEPAVTTTPPDSATPPATSSETVPSTEAAPTGGIVPSSEAPVSKEAAADAPSAGDSTAATTPIVPDANAPLPEKPIESK
jgi:outer membrane protein OmpA-like peptidoglycan-associated protein